MIRTKISAVTSVTYGLLSALIIAVIVGSLSAAGVGVENVFSAAGNGVAATAGSSTSTPISIGAPNSELTAEQQSQITNAAAEIAAGTASAACLQYMNNNASDMVSNNATCLGPGYGIAPPALPLRLEFNENYYAETNGQEYAYILQGSFSTSSATPGNGTIVSYSDGEVQNGGVSPGAVTECQTGEDYPYLGSGTATVIDNGNELVCSGIMSQPVLMYGGSNQSATNPFGYLISW